MSADLNEPDLLKRVPQVVKVCSATHIETLIRQALPGIQLLHVPSPPGSIPIKLNYQYFSVSQTGVAWEAVTRSRNFAAYVPGDFPAPQLEIDEINQLNGILTAEQDRLYTYGWIDQKAGTLHIPIDRAMDLVVQRGLPVRPESETASNTQNGTSESARASAIRAENGSAKPAAKRR